MIVIRTTAQSKTMRMTTALMLMMVATCDVLRDCRPTLLVSVADDDDDAKGMITR